MPSDLLEPEFADHFKAWKTNPTPESTTTLLKTVQPVIDSAINIHVGQSNPLLVSRARQMALEGIRRYDPSRSRLQTHLVNHLQGLKRVNRQQTAILKVPERVALDRYHLNNMTQELTDKLGREPSIGELANHTGFSTRRLRHVQSYKPAVAEGTMEASNETGEIYGGLIPQSKTHDTWRQLVYDDLPPHDQRIVDLHLQGHSNQDIARKLGVTPGAVSQRKAKIQALLDQESDLSPFGG